MFIEGSIFGVVDESPALHTVIFCSSPGGYVAGLSEWTVVDVSALVPPGTKAVFLTGMLIITHGSTAEVGDLHLYLRKHGSQIEPVYTGQVVEACVSGGSRSMYADWVTLNDGKFEYKWTRKTQGEWPGNCSYGINMKVVAYVR